MQLFIQPSVEFEKVAGEVDLPEDPNAWPKEVLDELFKQVPYISDFQPHVVMQRVDGERGYGFGHIELANQSEAQVGSDPQQVAASGVRSVRIPVVIKDGKLSPFDLLVNDASKVLPLTEARLRQAIFRPQAFDITGRGPGDQSLIGQLYPPYRQNMGFAGGGTVVPADAMGKMSSAMEKSASVFEEAIIADLEAHDGGFRYPGMSEEKTAERAERSGAVAVSMKPRPKMRKTAGVVDTVRKGAQKVLDKKGRELMYAGLRKDSPMRSRVGAAARQLSEKLEKKGSLLAEILPTIGPAALDSFWGKIQGDQGLQAAFTKNAQAAAGPLKLLADHNPMSPEKVASINMANYVHPTVVQLVRLDDGYMVKAASHLCWRPTKQVIGRGELVERFGVKVAFAVDTSGCVTMADDATAKEEVEKKAEYQAVSAPGIYKVQDSEGKELVGYVIPNLVDVDGSPLPVALFTNGSQATVQAEIFGEPVNTGANLPEGPVQGQGFFFAINQDGEIQATLPLTLQGSHQMGNEPSTFSGEVYDGRPVEVSLQPNIQEPIGTEEGKLLLPAHWRWSSLEGAQQVALAGGDEAAMEAKQPEGGGEPGPEGPEAPETSEVPTGEDSNPKEDAGYSSGSVNVKQSQAYVWARSSGETFSLSGPALEKIASEFMDFDSALFLLGGLGVDLGYGATKLAHSMSGARPERIAIGRYITLEEDLEKEAHARAVTKLASFPSLKMNLVKEAAVIPDPTAVDTVLSLGFVNPENIMSFVSYLPTIDDAQTKMCELLLAARLGLQDVPTTALERAVRSTEEAIEGLKIIAFQS